MSRLILKRAPIGWNQDDYDVLESDEFSLRGKTENTHILQVLSVKMNFSRVKRYGLPARKSEDVGAYRFGGETAPCLFQAFPGELANLL